MSQTVDNIVNRLTKLLPLAARQAQLSPELRNLHRAFLHSLVERGRPLTSAEIAALAPGHDALAAVWTLASMDLVVLDGTGEAVGAYPVTTEPTPHHITVNGNMLFAMCAFDAVSVEPMFGAPVTTRSRCPVTGAEIHIEQRDGRIVDLSPSPDVQVGIWWRDPGAVAARNLCPGIVFLRDVAAAQQWQAGQTSDHDFAPVADAAQAGAQFFGPLVESKQPVKV